MGNKNKAKHVYSPEVQRQLQGIALPPKVKCGRCEKYLGHANFSHKQLNDARFAIKNKGVNAKYKIHCSKCTGGPLVEVECTVCGVTKGLEEFSKVQRARPDTAKCFACVEKQLELDPVNEEVYEDPRKAFVPLDSSGGNYPEYWAQKSATSSASVSDYVGGEEDDDDGGVSVSLEKDFKKLSTADSYSKSVTSGYASATKSSATLVDVEGWQVAGSRNTRSSANKSGSAWGATNNFGSNVTERSDTIVTKNGWAKIKAYKPEPKPVPTEDDWKSESEEEDNGDDYDDDDSETEI